MIALVVRILLYIGAGYLLRAGLPPEVVAMLTDDPAISELLAAAVSGIVAGLTFWWSRRVKRVGGVT